MNFGYILNFKFKFKLVKQETQDGKAETKIVGVLVFAKLHEPTPFPRD